MNDNINDRTDHGDVWIHPGCFVLIHLYVDTVASVVTVPPIKTEHVAKNRAAIQAILKGNKEHNKIVPYRM